MKTIRATATGILVWILGVSVFTVSYFVPLMEDPDLQANIALAISLLPFAWLGASIYYRKGPETHGAKVGIIMVATAIILNGIITIPFMIIPYGGSYFSFFTATSFWLITFEYLMVVLLYWRIMVKPELIQS